MTHWTERSIDDYLYRIAADFVLQLERKIQLESLNQADLAARLGVSKGRISQLFNNPGNLTLKMIIKCARALGMKVALVSYEDNDPDNQQGPINSEIFRVCWERSGRPADFWAIKKPEQVAMNTGATCKLVKKDYHCTSVYGRTSDRQVSLAHLEPIRIDNAVYTGTSNPNPYNIALLH